MAAQAPQCDTTARAVPCSCLSSTSARLASPEAPTCPHIPQGAGLAPLAAALGAQEEEQLFFPFFSPQALTPPSFPGAVPEPCALQSTLPTARAAHCHPDPKTAKGGGL